MLKRDLRLLPRWQRAPGRTAGRKNASAAMRGILPDPPLVRILDHFLKQALPICEHPNPSRSPMHPPTRWQGTTGHTHLQGRMCGWIQQREACVMPHLPRIHRAQTKTVERENCEELHPGCRFLHTTVDSLVGFVINLRFVL